MSTASTATAKKTSSLSSLIWTFVAGVLISICVSFPCGFGAGWWSRKNGAEVVAKDGDEKAKEGTATISGRKLDDWTWQDLQDHLAKKGMKTRRGKGKYGMWFIVGEGEPIPPGWNGGTAMMDEMRDQQLSGDGCFLGTDAGSVNGANKSATRTKDVEQREVLALGRFIIQGSPAMLAKLKKLAP